MPSGRIDINTEAAGRGQSTDDVKKASEKLAIYNEKLHKKWIEKEAALRQKMVEAEAKGGYAARKKLEDKLTKEKEKAKKAEEKRAQKSAKVIAEYEKMLEEQAEQEKLDEAKRIEDEVAEYRGKKLKDSLGVFGQAATKAMNALGESVKDNIELYANYMSSINARLQGAGHTYESLNKTINRNTALNPYIKYTQVLEGLSRLVDLGIADNLTQRAFLEAISDKIATTFDAAETSLLSIVRIQQKDSTASRLGMEAELTKLFNYYFSDTSYLSNTFDSVQGALIDLSAQLGREASIEVEYMVQKWLGALGSVGVDSSTLQTIAQGVNYLGTGDVESLSSNAALQNLFVMAANRNNLNYNDMLTKGVNAQQVNALLEGVVEYIQEISQSSNNVVKKQYAQLFGLTMADMKAFQNLSDQVIGDLYNSAMTYQDTLTELNNQLSQVGSRMHLSEKIDNILDNAMAATGMGVANSTFGYATWKSFDMLEQITGGIELPFISAFGNGLDLNMTLEGLGKGTIVGISAAANLLGGIFNALGNGGFLSLDAWQTDPDKSGGFTGYQSANKLTTKKSTTNYVASSSEMGIQQSLSDSQKDTGEQVQGVQKSQEDEDFNAREDFYEPTILVLNWLKAYFEGGGSDTAPLKVQQTGLVAGDGSSIYTYTKGTI